MIGLDEIATTGSPAIVAALGMGTGGGDDGRGGGSAASAGGTDSETAGGDDGKGGGSGFFNPSLIGYKKGPPGIIFYHKRNRAEPGSFIRLINA